MAVNPKSIENLRPLNTRTPEERKAIQSKGGKASVKAYRERKTAKQQLKMYLELHPEIEKKMYKNLATRATNNTKDYVELLKIIGEYDNHTEQTVDASVNVVLKID